MANQLKTGLLLTILTIFLVFLGSLFGRTGALFAFFLAGVMNFFAYFYSDRMVLSMYRAREVPPDAMGWLHQMVEEMAQRAGIPKPRIYIIPTRTPNAFATGRDPNHAAVAVTEGLLDLLTREELKGVLGHELTHIKDRDTLISTLTATLAGAITLLARLGMWGMYLGDDDNRGNPLVLLAIIFLPLAALLIRLAVSRSREYLADDGGAWISGNPLYLASALEKLSFGVKRVPMRDANPSTSHMFIVNPLTGSGITALFSTHPPTEARIARLKRMAGLVV